MSSLINCYPEYNLPSYRNDLYSTSSDSWFPEINASTISKVALGALTAVAELSAIAYFVGLKIAEDQDIFQIWKSLGSMSPSILGVVSKVALLGYVVLIGPVVEEFLFRGLLHQTIVDFLGGPDSILCRILAVFGDGFIFGLAHLSIAQGSANVPIFIGTFILGCIFATLREVTGDITASSTAHIVHNGCVMALFLSTAGF